MPIRSAGTERGTLRALGMRSALLAAVALVAGITLSALSASPAKADFRVCNFSGSTTEIAFGYYEPQDGWSSRGWMRLQLGECKVALPGNLQSSTYYVYGRSEDGRLLDGPASQAGGFFCIKQPKFELRSNAYTTGQSLNCEAGGVMTAHFLAVTVASPDFTYTLSPGMGQIGTALAPLTTIIRDQLRTQPPGAPSAVAGGTVTGSVPPLPTQQPGEPLQTVASQPTVIQTPAQVTAVAQPTAPPYARPGGGPLAPPSASTAATACQRFPNLC